MHPSHISIFWTVDARHVDLSPRGQSGPPTSRTRAVEEDAGGVGIAVVSSRAADGYGSRGEGKIRRLL